MLDDLKEAVCQANHQLVARGLISMPWAGVSGITDNRNAFVINAADVACDRLRPTNMVVIDMEGNVVEGDHPPATCAPTHLILYKAFEQVGGVVNTQSPKATAFAQARRVIPCFGSAHARYFHGPIPLTRALNKRETTEAYEAYTGYSIVECFKDRDPLATPAALAAGQGPFAWGRHAMDAVDNAAALEAVASMAVDTFLLDDRTATLERYVIDVHYQLRHGAVPPVNVR